MLPERTHEQPDPGERSYRQPPELHVDRPVIHPLVSSVALESTLASDQSSRPLAKSLSQSQVDRCQEGIRHRDRRDQATQHEHNQWSNCLLSVTQGE